jgi:D-sedoheptulose 7-phosphate isomerase
MPNKPITQLVDRYYSDFSKALTRIAVTGPAGKKQIFSKGIDAAVSMILDQQKAGGRVYFIGNGASAAISSHQSADFTKAGRVPAHCFNDPALLTCMGNDYGYKHVFEKPVELFMGAADILVAISSSGKSENILRAVRMAKHKSSRVITLSGFEAVNPLRALGDLNFYVPSREYGHCEVAHHSICHCILDTLISVRDGK